jgi:hypothetical protein
VNQLDLHLSSYLQDISVTSYVTPLLLPCLTTAKVIVKDPFSLLLSTKSGYPSLSGCPWSGGNEVVLHISPRGKGKHSCTRTML